jgi:hypothetical protein
LLEACLNDAKGKKGIVAVTSKKVMPFLTDKGFFLKRGFEVCDTAPPYFELLVKPLRKAPPPRFKACAKKGTCPHGKGLSLYYSYQCPFTHHYVDEMTEAARKRTIPCRKILVKTRRDAQNLPSPFTILGAYLDGAFLTHKVMSEAAFGKMLDKAVRG